MSSNWWLSEYIRICELAEEAKEGADTNEGLVVVVVVFLRVNFIRQECECKCPNTGGSLSQRGRAFFLSPGIFHHNSAIVTISARVES